MSLPPSCLRNLCRPATAFGLLAWLLAVPASAQGEVFRCPGPPVLYTDALSPDEARAKGCRTIEGAPITIVQSPRRPPPVAAGGGSAPATPSASGGRGGVPDARVDQQTQRQRDADARQILQSELQREEARLAQLQKDYNNGQPERRGEERNYQTYLDRVAAMKASITRAESDIAAIRREIAKLGS
jgi:hypothetical protein